MEAKELRIGNLIKTDLQYIDTDNDYMDVNGNLICAIEDGDYEGEPIPLTEEWLVKFGFKSMLNQFANRQTNIPFIILKLEGIFVYDDLRFQTHINHVHQLQNLYFALTGEELKIK